MTFTLKYAFTDVVGGWWFQMKSMRIIHIDACYTGYSSPNWVIDRIAAVAIQDIHQSKIICTECNHLRRRFMINGIFSAIHECIF